MKIRHKELIESWVREEHQPFTGWDFSYLGGRMTQDNELWSYLGRAAEQMRFSSSVLDMDTGRGEKLLSLREDWPAKVVATEDYLSNFELASERLAPLGAKVVKKTAPDDDSKLFAAGQFDLVLNRHAGFRSNEVARLLAPSGTFLTRQVRGIWAWDLQAAFDAEPQWPDATPARYIPRLEAAGLTIATLEEWEGHLKFADVGAISYNLKAVPWLVPGFTVKSHLRYLLALQERVEAGKELTFYAAKYLIEARKPQGGQSGREPTPLSVRPRLKGWRPRATSHGN